jgi:serine-type D-Ala-D-Ala carboxypeptidase (penicillin-binding protein 5/6)
MSAGTAVLGSAAPSLAVIGGSQLSGTGVIVNYRSSHDKRLPNVRASAWVIADAGTGQVLAAKDPHGEYRPASTLKVLTAVTLIPKLNPSATLVATKLAATQTPNDIGLLAGHSYTVSSLFTALLTISANDAAVALTQGAGDGSLAQGMTLINAEAHHLQADDTVAVTPNGLDAPGQHTSAYDLALIARQALSLPAFLRYDEVEGGLFKLSAHKSVGLWNQNNLLTQYRGGIGGKIGWTSTAGATYVGMARRNGVTLIVTLLHCPALTEVTSAEKLLNWGFAEDGKIAPAGTLVAPLSAVTPKPAPSVRPQAPQDAHVTAARHASLSSPSALAAIGFTVVAVLAAAASIIYSRRQRPHSPRQLARARLACDGPTVHGLVTFPGTGHHRPF